MTDDGLLAELLSDTRAVVRQLLEEPVGGPEVLWAAVDAARARIAERSDPSADTALAEALADRCAAWLGRWGELDGGAQRLVQVAVRYFALDADGDDDWVSVFGFDDDREVLDAIARRLGEPAIEAP
ncbi:MAG: hypothetical protein ABMA64_20790 [Myxococcota bacterium]